MYTLLPPMSTPGVGVEEVSEEKDESLPASSRVMGWLPSISGCVLEISKTVPAGSDGWAGEWLGV